MRPFPREEPVRIGLVVNVCAGAGTERIRAAARRALGRLSPASVVVLAGGVEEQVAREAGGDIVLVPAGNGTASRVETAASAVIETGVDVLVGVGGDGTLCDIAAALRPVPMHPPLLGIGMGSANVGPLVGVREADVESIERGRLGEALVRSLEAFVATERVGHAFNDVAISNSFFGTRAGQRLDLDAAGKLDGETREIEPSSVCTPGTWIAKNDRRLVDNTGGWIRQVVASPVDDARAYAGKAISGLMCWAPYVGNHGVLAAASRVMIRTKLQVADVEAAEPLRLAHVSFGAGDVVEIGGMEDGAVVVLDGNPMRRLGENEVLTLRLSAQAIRVLRIG